MNTRVTRCAVLSTLFSMLCFMLIAPSSILAQELNTNGSFENTEPGVVEDLAEGVEGWVLETSLTDDDAPVFEIVEDPVQDGDHALKVTVNGVHDDDWAVQAVADAIPVVPGRTYEYSVWARSESGGGTASFTVGNYAFQEYGRLGFESVSLTAEWQEFTLEFTVTDEETSIRAPIHFSFDENAGNAVYIDNLRITDPDAGKRPVIVEAESGELGDEFDTLTDGEDSDTTYITITTDYNETTGDGNHPGANRTASYTVTFPDSGLYDLYARVRVGADGFDDDSFFYGDGFGEKDPEAGADWIIVNGLASAGYDDPDAYIEAAGTAGFEVWKWVNLSENTFQSDVADTFAVSLDALTQTFEIGAREDGLDIDKFAFAPARLFYTGSNLDNGEAGVEEVPGEPVPEPEGPPLAEGLDKFLGNVYSSSQIEHFEHYWNQVTPENAGKWGSVEVNRDEMNWTSLDAAYALAKDNDWPFRFHVLIWGNQQPDWMADLSTAEQLEEIGEWFDSVAVRYPDIDYLEVVNEPLHDPPDDPEDGGYIEALGGEGDTGWDWVITAFEMARERFPEDTKLMINDYGILGSMSEAQEYREIIELLQAEDLIDGIGVQGHAFSTRAGAPLEAVLDTLAKTGLPIQVTEMDVDGNPNESDITEEESDENQEEAIDRIFPVLWEHEAVEGITFWGWRPGMWRTPQEAYLVRENGEERPAMTWLKEYIESYRETSIEYVAETPEAFRLVGNYPNPFNPTTQIRYDLAEPAQVTLTVFDVLGRQVQTLVDSYQTSGEYTVSFDARSLASGIYLYRLQAGSFVQTKQMLLVK